MRILYFTRAYSPHDYRFLSSLAATSHKVYYLRLERRGIELEDRPVPVEVEQVIWRGGRKPARWQDGLALHSSLNEVIRRIKPDVVHAGPLQTSAFLAAWCGFHPLVSMSWGSDLLRDAQRNAWWRWATRFTLEHSDGMIGDCQAVRQKAMALGFPEEKITIFPWGVDLEHFSPLVEMDLRRRLGWENAFVVLSLRSWEAVYGVDVVVAAFIEAARQQSELRLMLLGGGSQSTRLHRMIEDSQMEDRVFFGGQVNQVDLPHYYRAADLYVSASHSDGSSVSLMEALACGKPVLVTDIPSNREWVTPEKQGWLFPDNAPAALAEGILRAAAQRQALAEMGVQARALAEKRANWKQNFQVLLQAYEKSRLAVA